ncbi:MAG TPA: isochorismate synthase [Acidimicrobiales bacterium]|nr:isochorismate synthase [Acidimicrobiales bacterium]
MTTDLHARTVPLEYGPDALEFDGSPTVLFDRPGLTLVGWGTALLVEASDAATVLAAIPCDDTVRCPGSGVLALGALPFLGTMAGLLIVPRFTMGVARDPDGTAYRWATAVGPNEVALPEPEELFDAVIWQYGSAGDGAGARDVDVTELTTSLPTDDYENVVARAVATMSARGAALHKVVLARSVNARLSGTLPLSRVLRRLRSHEPHCTIFSVPVPKGTFFGASPELLVARQGERISCHPLAGTIARGETARSDADAQGRLAASAKDHEEHRYVVEDIAATLAPYCSALTVPAEPSLVAFHSVAHLGTRIEGLLHEPTPVLALVRELHPTPAVGGTPRAAALAAIAEGEPVPRGHWAGPVGWVDAEGNGEWMIGLRSACLHADGESVTLHAGSGVVAASDPRDEAAETNMKLATVLESLVPGGSAHLG